MLVTVCSYKGGVGKTTTAVHLSAYFQQHAPTLLIDGDPNRSASAWERRGAFPFKVVDERQAARYARDYEHIIFDTQARPTAEDLSVLIEGCDLLIVPSTPDALALDALMLTVDVLQRLQAKNYRVLLTMIPPRPTRDVEDARRLLAEAGIPLFHTSIRRLVAFQKAGLHGVTVDQVDDPRADQGWADYLAVGQEILQ